MIYYFLFGALLCYTLPFYVPLLWPFIWLFPLFLLSLFVHKKFSVTIIIIWSLAATSLHLLPLCTALIAMAAGPFFLKLVFPLLLIMYVALYPIAWLTITFLLRRMISSVPLLLAIWTFCLWCYVIVLEYALLWPFGTCEGYLFINPLLTMAIFPPLLAPLHYVSLPFVLLWFCSITSTLYGAIAHHSKIFIIVILLTSPWVFMIFYTPQEDPPRWLNSIGHLPLSFAHETSVEKGQRILMYEINKLYQRYPSLSLVILPESAWNNTLLTHQKKLEYFINHPIKHVIIGAFATEMNHHFNSLFWYDNGTQCGRHDKRHAVPLTERVIGTMIPFYHTLYFQKSNPISSSCKKRRALSISGIGTFSPYICSELFCISTPDDEKSCSLLVISNDSWFMPHFQKLMALGSRLRAIQWQRSLLYISFHYAQFFNHWGESSRIATTPPSRFIE